MAQKPSGLGRGLGALLGEDAVREPQSATLTLKLTDVEPNANQPRKHFDDEALAMLADSIRQHGILQPLAVRKLPSGYYQIIAGERRWRAARLAGLAEVPAIIYDVDDRLAAELALIENLQREDLNPIEEADGFRSLIEEYGLTQEDVAQRVGKSRPYVANSVRLLGLADELQELVRVGKLSGGHARAVLQLKSEKQQLKAAHEVVEGGLSVRAAEQLVKKMAEEKQTVMPNSDAALTVNYTEHLSRELSGEFGRRVNVTQGRHRGRIELEYYGADDLEQLLSWLRRQ